MGMGEHPHRLPMFPLSTVLFPYSRLPLHVFEPRYRALVDDCTSGDGCFGVVLITRGHEVGGGDERAGIGTLASVETTEMLQDGRSLVVVRGIRRIRVVRWLEDDPYPRAEVGDWGSPPPEDERVLHDVAAKLRQVLALASELGHGSSIRGSLPLGHDAAEAVWRLCSLAPVNAFDRQQLLEVPGHTHRLILLDELVTAVGEDLRHMLAGG